jgi:uncharacterized protein (TIGR03000 family)
MIRPFCTWPPLALVLAAIVFLQAPVQAQSTNPYGGYPYWATAPGGYGGSVILVPVPGMSPNTISNAARSPSMWSSSLSGLGSDLGGGYRLPLLTAKGAENKAHIWLRVPKDAEIWFQGVKTRQTGEWRYFYSPPLTAGKKYSYAVRVSWKEDGKPVEVKQNLVVSAGAMIRRDMLSEGKSKSSAGSESSAPSRPSAKK